VRPPQPRSGERARCHRRTLVEERRRIRRVLAELPEHFTEVRYILNELSRTVR
jgi:hypothetical protein